MDVDGSESNIFRGARKTFARNPDVRVIFECMGEYFPPHEFAALKDAGFHFWRIDLSDGDLTPIYEIPTDILSVDLLMTRAAEPLP
jgi:hypothetical protein